MENLKKTNVGIQYANQVICGTQELVFQNEENEEGSKDLNQKHFVLIF